MRSAGGRSEDSILCSALRCSGQPRRFRAAFRGLRREDYRLRSVRSVRSLYPTARSSRRPGRAAPVALARGICFSIVPISVAATPRGLATCSPMDGIRLNAAAWLAGACIPESRIRQWIRRYPLRQLCAARRYAVSSRIRLRCRPSPRRLSELDPVLHLRLSRRCSMACCGRFRASCDNASRRCAESLPARRSSKIALRERALDQLGVPIADNYGRDIRQLWFHRGLSSHGNVPPAITIRTPNTCLSSLWMKPGARSLAGQMGTRARLPRSKTI